MTHNEEVKYIPCPICKGEKLQTSIACWEDMIAKHPAVKPAEAKGLVPLDENELQKVIERFLDKRAIAPEMYLGIDLVNIICERFGTQPKALDIRWPEEIKYKAGWIYTASEQARIEAHNAALSACKQAVQEAGVGRTLDRTEVWNLIEGLPADFELPLNYQNQLVDAICQSFQPISLTNDLYEAIWPLLVKYHIPVDSRMEFKEAIEKTKAFHPRRLMVEEIKKQLTYLARYDKEGDCWKIPSLDIAAQAIEKAQNGEK